MQKLIGVLFLVIILLLGGCRANPPPTQFDYVLETVWGDMELGRDQNAYLEWSVGLIQARDPFEFARLSSVMPFRNNYDYSRFAEILSVKYNPDSTCIEVRWRNKSNYTVQDSRFRITYIDSTGIPTPLGYAWSTKTILPGQEGLAELRAAYCTPDVDFEHGGSLKAEVNVLGLKPICQ